MIPNDPKIPKPAPSPNIPERFPVVLRGFYPACLSSELGVRVARSVRVFDREFVLCRSSEGVPFGLVDRCPHRNVPLSAGRVGEAGEIECAYHGWRFAPTGECTAIPGLRVVPDKVRVGCVSVREVGGIVWVWPEPDRQPTSEPNIPTEASDPRYTTVLRHVSAAASLYRVAENALDVPHTSILHRGLFRSGQRQRVEVTVRRDARSVEAEYRGERAPRGALARVLTLGLPPEARGLEISHWDRFALPSTIQVEYRLGSAAHFVITAFGRPVSPEQTELYVMATFRTRLPGVLIQTALEPLARWVFAQDRSMLARQTRLFGRQGPPSYHSTVLDTLSQEIWRLLKAASEDEGGQGGAGERAPGEPTGTAEKTFELWA